MKIDMMPFCDPDSTYYGINRPWRIGDMLFATDTRLAVACAPELYGGEIADAKDERRRPKVNEVLEPALSIQKWNDMPFVKECRACGSTGRVKVTCSECFGSGTVTCNMEHEHDCDMCDEEGEEISDCKHCPPEFGVGNRKIASWILRRILRLPNVKWAVTTDDCNQIVFVKFDGGYGAMMPIQQEVREKIKSGACR